MGKGFICIKAILKYRHGSLPQSKLSRELAKQAVTTKCRDNINAELAVPFEKAVDFRAKNKNLWTKRTQTTDGFYRPQINTDWHRLRAKGSD